jgi:hypothetical protein
VRSGQQTEQDAFHDQQLSSTGSQRNYATDAVEQPIVEEIDENSEPESEQQAEGNISLSDRRLPNDSRQDHDNSDASINLLPQRYSAASASSVVAPRVGVDPDARRADDGVAVDLDSCRAVDGVAVDQDGKRADDEVAVDLDSCREVNRDESVTRQTLAVLPHNDPAEIDKNNQLATYDEIPTLYKGNHMPIFKDQVRGATEPASRRDATEPPRRRDVWRRDATDISPVLVEAMPVVSESSALSAQSLLSQGALDDAHPSAPYSRRRYFTFFMRAARFLRLHRSNGSRRLLMLRGLRHESFASDQAIAMSRNRAQTRVEIYNSHDDQGNFPTLIRAGTESTSSEQPVLIRTSTDSTSSEQRMIAHFDRCFAALTKDIRNQEELVLDIITSVQAMGQQSINSFVFPSHDPVVNIVRHPPDPPHGMTGASAEDQQSENFFPIAEPGVMSNAGFLNPSLEMGSTVLTTSPIAEDQESVSFLNLTLPDPEDYQSNQSVGMCSDIMTCTRPDDQQYGTFLNHFFQDPEVQITKTPSSTVYCDQSVEGVSDSIKNASAEDLQNGDFLLPASRDPDGRQLISRDVPSNTDFCDQSDEADLDIMTMICAEDQRNRNFLNFSSRDPVSITCNCVQLREIEGSQIMTLPAIGSQLMERINPISRKAAGPGVIVVPTLEGGNDWLASSLADLSFPRLQQQQTVSTVRRVSLTESKRVPEQLKYRILDKMPELSHFSTRSLFLCRNAIYVLTCEMSGLLCLRSNDDATMSEQEVTHYILTYLLDQILPCIEQINAHAPGSLIIPVVIAEQESSKADVNHFQYLLRQSLEDYRNKFTAIRIFTECIVRIFGSEDLEGVQLLRERIILASEDASVQFLQHVRDRPPDGTVELQKAIRKMKKVFPIISLKDLLKEASNKDIPEPVAKVILSFLRNTGEIIYCGELGDESPSDFVILSKKWSASMVSRISRDDFRKKIDQERQFRRLRDGDEQEIEEEDFPFDKFSRCPILSGKDVDILLGLDNCDVVEFLQRIFVHFGLFYPIGLRIFLVPRLLDSYAKQYDGWTYKCRGESYMGSLCSLFKFSCRQSPEMVILQLFARVISDLAVTTPESLSQLRIAQCWKNAFRLQWKSVDIFVVWLESWQVSSASYLKPGVRSIAVFGKGNLYHSVKGCYGQVREIISDMLVTAYDSTSEVLCYHCLQTTNVVNAGRWSWAEAHEASKSDDPLLICKRGHSMNSTLACGICKAECFPTFGEVRSLENRFQECIVIVGMLNSENELVSVASGFIIDAKQGLVVTVGHAIFDMENHDHEMLGCKAVVARVLPGLAPVWYFSVVEASNIKTTDVCILRICARVENCQFDQSGIPINLDNIHLEYLSALSLSRTGVFPEERVRIMGFPHSKSENGFCDYVESVEGRIERLHMAPNNDDNNNNNNNDVIRRKNASDSQAWLPSQEIVVNSCSGVKGQSGGPCLNEDYEVVGIYCRGQESHVDYLVPASEIDRLLRRCR